MWLANTFLAREPAMAGGNAEEPTYEMSGCVLDIIEQGRAITEYCRSMLRAAEHECADRQADLWTSTA